MTAPNGAILFNSSTGSDTTASGLGSANVYGSGASTTGSSAVVTSIDTTGVSSGDLLWVQSSSGRQFSIIATVDSSTQVTCDDTFANTESGRTWAIGGKRATLAGSQRIYDDGSTADGDGDWIIELEDGYTETISSTINLRVATGSMDGGFILRGQAGSVTKPVLTFTNQGNSFVFYASYATVQNIELKNSATTISSTVAFTSNSYITLPKLIDVDIHDPTDNYYHGVYIYASGATGIVCEGCSVGNVDGVGLYPRVAAANTSIVGCRIFNCGSSGFHHNYLTTFQFENNLVYGNGSHGLYIQNGAGYISGNIIANNTGDGINISSNLARIHGNIIAGNANGIVRTGTAIQGANSISRNAFYGNTTANVTGFSRSENEVLLTADPFVDAAAGDFTLNADAGGGATLRANNFALNTDTSVYPFRQYVSDDFGGGGATVHPLRSN